MSGRFWLGFGAAGCALVLGCRGDWRAAAVAAVAIAVPIILYVCGELAATRAMMREESGPESGCGRHRKRSGEAPAGLVESYTCSRCGDPGETTWESEEAAARGRRIGLDLVCDTCLVGAIRVAVRSSTADSGLKV